jgi:L,D-transpeptidase catalytic domain
MMRTIFFSLFCICIFIICTCYSNHPDPAYFSTIKKYTNNSYNQQIAFYADLSQSSGYYRFYVLDLVHNTVLTKGLCCNGKTDWKNNVLYSNAANSNCSSKGLYMIGPSYIGNFGKAYRLYGLQSTNSNVLNRGVVLHSHRCVPFIPYFFPIAKSKGCPTVNAQFFKELDSYISDSDKPILLYIE